MRRGQIVVESGDVALAEAEDLLIPIEEARSAPDTSSPISRRSPAAPRCVAPPRTSRCSKGVGMAFEDLVVAKAVVDTPS